MVGVRKALFVNEENQWLYDTLRPDHGLMNITPHDSWENQHVKRIAEKVQEHRVWLNYLSEVWMARAIAEGWVTSDETYAMKMVEFSSHPEVAGFFLDDLAYEPYARLLDEGYYSRILAILKTANKPIMTNIWDGWTGPYPPELGMGEYVKDTDFPFARFGIEFTDIYMQVWLYGENPAKNLEFLEEIKTKFPGKRLWLALYPTKYPTQFKRLLEWGRQLFLDGEIEGVWLYSSTELIANPVFVQEAVEVLNEPFQPPGFDCPDPDCFLVFPTQEALDQHIADEHPPPPPTHKGCVLAFLLTSTGLSTVLPSLRLLRSHLPRSIVKGYYSLSGFMLQGVIR